MTPPACPSPTVPLPASARAGPTLQERFPVEEYLRPLLDAPPHASYGHIPSATLAIAHSIEAEAGPAALADYHRQVLRALLAQAPARIASAGVPASVRSLLDLELARIGAELGGQHDDFYRFGNDLFRKDLALCLLRLLPCGAELVHVGAGIRGALLLRGGWRQALRTSSFFALRARGLRPYCSLHMDRRRLTDFTPEGWERTYLRLADLLLLHPEIRGVFGTAWFYDPALREISPRLAYLREVREAYGARNFRFGTGPAVVADATERSPTRRRLHAEGRYVPAAHYLVWLRADLLRWAAEHRGRIRMVDGYAA